MSMFCPNFEQVPCVHVKIMYLRKTVAFNQIALLDVLVPSYSERLSMRLPYIHVYKLFRCIVYNLWTSNNTALA